MRDSLFLVVAVEMSRWRGEGGVRTTAQHHAAFVFGHLLDEGACVLADRFAGRALTDRQNHVDDPDQSTGPVAEFDLRFQLVLAVRS